MRERRRFTSRQKAALYISAGGRCQCEGCDDCGPYGCGQPLDPGWHADHKQPHSRDGKTSLANGQALCPPCNLSKGSKLIYRDTFQPRPFQTEVVNKVLDGMASGRSTTIVLASPGSGKTLAYQAAATYAYRRGLADLLAVFVPRIVLAQQCETSWLAREDDGTLTGDHRLFDQRCRLGRIRHTPNRPPLTGDGETGVGYVTTYSALVANPVIYQEWAQENKGRFLLVADEAQFCGAENGESGGTRSGALIEDLHELAAHTLLLTGTPYRSDGQKLILSDYGEPNDEGKRPLLSHAEATYSTGVGEGYLRPFEATLRDARVRWQKVGGEAQEYDLSMSGADLVEVLRKPEVWQSVADDVVAAIREKQKVNPRYRGLISCMEQGDARNVYRYLTESGKFPGLRVLKATSEDGKGAEEALKAFKWSGGDVLVTVRKAFIGYDCKPITVVGVLTHYRDWGHLEQLVGRGLRVWDEMPIRSQSCRVIAPDDPAMKKFIEYMRDQSENGLRERRRRENGEGDDPGGSGDDDTLGYVESAHATTARAVSNDIELDHDQRRLIEAVKHDVGSCEDVTVLARFAEKLGMKLAQAPECDVSQPPDSAPITKVPLTEQQRIDAIGVQVQEEVKEFLKVQGVRGDRPDYGAQVQHWTAQVNRKSGYRAGDCRTTEQAEARLTAARELWRRFL